MMEQEFVELCRHPAIADRAVSSPLSLCWCEHCQKVEPFHDSECNTENAVVLPPVFDIQHPERSFDGMLESYELVKWKRGYYVIASIGTRLVRFDGATPGIALAKAVIWQAERRER